VLSRLAAQVTSDEPVRVACENCSDATSRWIALAALIVAVGSAVLAGWQLHMARQEHAEFMGAFVGERSSGSSPCRSRARALRTPLAF
jgi:hypothetical protein